MATIRDVEAEEKWRELDIASLGKIRRVGEGGVKSTVQILKENFH